MNIKITSFIIVFGLFMGLPQNIQKKIDAEIKNTFDIEDFSFSEKTISPDVASNLPAKFGKDNFFQIKAKDVLLGYAYVSKAPSKTDDFDYLVLLNPELVVVKAKVLAYREDYGGEIGSKRWLKQFIGKTEHDDLKYQHNIVAISGATISVRSMTNAVNNVLKSLKILHAKNLL